MARSEAVPTDERTATCSSDPTANGQRTARASRRTATGSRGPQDDGGGTGRGRWSGTRSASVRVPRPGPDEVPVVPARGPEHPDVGRRGPRRAWIMVVVPELPEVEALAAFLRENAVGHVLARADLASVQAIKTFDPPLSALAGLEITGASRHGKFLDLDVSGLHLVVHLARAGWLHWRTGLPTAPPKPGKGPLALRVHLDDGNGFDLTEQGTRKGLAVYVVRSPAEVPGIARLGPDALQVDREQFAALLSSRSGQLKGALTEQSLIRSDERRVGKE